MATFLAKLHDDTWYYFYKCEFEIILLVTIFLKAFVNNITVKRS